MVEKSDNAHCESELIFFPCGASWEHVLLFQIDRFAFCLGVLIASWMLFVELEVKRFFWLAFVKHTNKWHTKLFADGAMQDTVVFALLVTFGSKPHVVFFQQARCQCLFGGRVFAGDGATFQLLP